MSLEKGSMLFIPWNYLISAKKIKLVRATEITNWVRRLHTNKTFQKSNIIFEGSRHPNWMNPFEYGKSFHNKNWDPNPTQPQNI